MSNTKRKYFSGKTLQQALLAAASEHQLPLEEISYRRIEKRHGFLKAPKKVLIAVDPESPRRKPGEPASPESGTSSPPKVSAPAAQSASSSEPERSEAEGRAGAPASAGSGEPEERDDHGSEGEGKKDSRREPAPSRRHRGSGGRRGDRLASESETVETGRPESVKSQSVEKEAPSSGLRSEERGGRSGGGGRRGARGDSPGGPRGDQREGRSGSGGGRAGGPPRSRQDRGASGRGNESKPSGRRGAQGGPRRGPGAGGGSRKRGFQAPVDPVAEEQAAHARRMMELERAEKASGRREEVAEAPEERKVEPREAKHHEVSSDSEPAEQAMAHLLAVSGLDIDATVEVDGEEVDVEIDGPDAELLLESGGRPLAAMEHLLPKVLRGITGKKFFCHIDCLGFREKRQQELEDRARELADAVRESGDSKSFEPLNPAERRIVHMTLAEDPDVETESKGGGYLKRLTIWPV